MNELFWTEVHSTLLIFEPGLTCCSLLIDWSERLWFSFAVYIQRKTFIFCNSTTKTITVKYACTEKFISIKFLFHLLKPSLTLPQILTQVNKHLPHHQSYIRGLTKSYSHHLVFNNEKIVMSEFKNGHQKLKRIMPFGHLQISLKWFQRLMIVSSMMWILYHT